MVGCTEGRWLGDVVGYDVGATVGDFEGISDGSSVAQST